MVRQTTPLPISQFHALALPVPHDPDPKWRVVCSSTCESYSSSVAESAHKSTRRTQHTHREGELQNFRAAQVLSRSIETMRSGVTAAHRSVYASVHSLAGWLCACQRTMNGYAAWRTTLLTLPMRLRARGDTHKRRGFESLRRLDSLVRLIAHSLSPSSVRCEQVSRRASRIRSPLACMARCVSYRTLATPDTLDPDRDHCRDYSDATLRCHADPPHCIGTLCGRVLHVLATMQEASQASRWYAHSYL